MIKWESYKTNIQVKPIDKGKIIGNTAKYYLYGEVVGVGSEVKDIKVGDMVGYTIFGVEEILEADGTKTFYLQDNPDFILAISKKNEA